MTETNKSIYAQSTFCISTEKINKQKHCNSFPTSIRVYQGDYTL